MSGVDSAALARVVYILCRCVRDRDSATTLVDLHSAVDAGSFFAWEVGWDHGQENPVLFWFMNTGFFIPLLLIAILMRGEGYLVPKRLLLFYLPFTLCFIVPNLIKMAPWIWDNIKVLYYWWLASAPLVALLLARLWHQGRTRRVLAVVLFVCVTLAGALDVAGIAMRRSSTRCSTLRDFALLNW